MKSISVSAVAGAGAAVALSLSTLAQAQPPALGIKLGEWQMTSTIKMSGQAPSFDSSQMTAEQKARMEAMLKALMTTRTATTKTCMTKDRMQQTGFLLGGDEGDAQSCKRTLNTNTKRVLDSKVECTGENAQSAALHVEATAPTSVKGTIHSTRTREGRTMVMDVTFTGKWLQSACKASD